MLVVQRRYPPPNFYLAPDSSLLSLYSWVERDSESKVSCLRTQHRELGQGLNPDRATAFTCLSIDPLIIFIDILGTSVDLDEARAFLGTVEDMCSFHVFLRGTAGQKILLYWIDAERYRRVTKREHRRFAFREIQATYLRSGSPRELPEIIKWASLCGWTPQGDRSSSFTIPKSITKRMYISDSSLFSENVFLTGQKMALERLSIYWVPKYIQHKKILRKLIAEKRGVCSEFRAETRLFSPVPELDNPVSRTRSEQEIDDFMEAQCVSSTESVTETDEEIRARKLEEWKKWFWEGVDSQTGSETKVEPPEDMPLELRQLGGVSTGNFKIGKFLSNVAPSCLVKHGLKLFRALLNLKVPIMKPQVKIYFEITHPINLCTPLCSITITNRATPDYSNYCCELYEVQLLLDTVYMLCVFYLR